MTNPPLTALDRLRAQISSVSTPRGGSNLASILERETGVKWDGQMSMGLGNYEYDEEEDSPFFSELGKVWDIVSTPSAWSTQGISGGLSAAKDQGKVLLGNLYNYITKDGALANDWNE